MADVVHGTVFGHLLLMGADRTPIKADFHTHTTLCDGRDTPEEMVQAAIGKGLRQLGFSGHMDPGIHMDFEEYCREIGRLRNKYSGAIDILMGVELDTLYDPRCAARAEYVIGSTHYLDTASDRPLAIDLNREQFQFICREFFGGDYMAMSKAYYGLVASSHDRTGCDIIGHFDLVTKFNDGLYCIDENSSAYIGPALEAMRYLCDEGVVFEINTGAYTRGIKKDVYPNTFFLKKLREFGGRIIIDSDAHRKEALTGCFDHAAERAIACGFRCTHIIRHDEQGKAIFKEIALCV